MAETSTTRRPDRQRVLKAVAWLDQLPDREFADQLADVVAAKPDELDVDVQAAFRTPALVAKSLAAAKFHIDQVNARVKREAGENTREWRARQEYFRSRMGMERRLLENVAQGVRAQQGIVPNRPNPRGWADEHLKESTITVECECGRVHKVKLYPWWKRLFEGRKAELKRARRAQRRAARGGVAR